MFKLAKLLPLDAMPCVMVTVKGNVQSLSAGSSACMIEFCLSSPDTLLQVQQLVDMGFPYDIVSRALLAAGGDQNAALERLLG